ncbi:unnamed protein product [Boreogadus saida]
MNKWTHLWTREVQERPCPTALITSVVVSRRSSADLSSVSLLAEPAGCSLPPRGTRLETPLHALNNGHLFPLAACEPRARRSIVPMRCTLCTEGLANEAPRFEQPDSYCMGAHSGARPCDVTGRFPGPGRGQRLSAFPDR